MAQWARHSGDSWWHVVDAPVGGSVPTRCNGRWPETDEDVEYASHPPHDQRCDYCQRSAIEVTRVERALAELAAAAPFTDEWPSAHEFDFGGES